MTNITLKGGDITLSRDTTPEELLCQLQRLCDRPLYLVNGSRISAYNDINEPIPGRWDIDSISGGCYNFVDGKSGSTLCVFDEKIAERLGLTEQQRKEKTRPTELGIRSIPPPPVSVKTASRPPPRPAPPPPQGSGYPPPPQGSGYPPPPQGSGYPPPPYPHDPYAQPPGPGGMEPYNPYSGNFPPMRERRAAPTPRPSPRGNIPFSMPPGRGGWGGGPNYGMAGGAPGPYYR